MPFLRFHAGWMDQKSAAFRDAFPDLSDPQDDRGEGLQCGCDGYGEPLDNYDNLLRFIRMLTDEKGQNISQRNITVSTCGLVPEIRKLAEENLQITLALSLHAPNQQKREQLMPIARRYSLPEVLDACRYYFEKTGRRMTFEYSLVGERTTVSRMRRNFPA